MKTFGQRLKEAREKAGYETAKAFAEALGEEPPTYRYWERGGASPDLATFTRICQLLDCEPNQLLPSAIRRQGKPSSAGRPAA